MQPQKYPTAEAYVEFIGTLLSGAVLSWFSPLLKKNSPILADLDNFLVEFNIFGDIDRIQIAITKFRSLQQKPRAALTYAVEFRFFANDVDWDNNALINTFRWGLQDDVKDLFLNMLDLTSLSKAIMQAVRCDNSLFERQQERRSTQGSYQTDSSFSI